MPVFVPVAVSHVKQVVLDAPMAAEPAGVILTCPQELVQAECRRPVAQGAGFGEWGELLGDRLREKRQAGLFSSHRLLGAAQEGHTTTDRIAGHNPGVSQF